MIEHTRYSILIGGMFGKSDMRFYSRLSVDLLTYLPQLDHDNRFLDRSVKVTLYSVHVPTVTARWDLSLVSMSGR